MVVVVLAGCTPSAPPANPSPPATIPPPAPSATSVTPSPSASPIDTASWITYESKQYGFSIKHPPGWTVWPAERGWTLGADAGGSGLDGQETFLTPAEDLYVAVRSAPAKDTPETLEGVAAWVKRYCKLSGKSCGGLDESVPLCNGTDCGPGLLVTVDGEFVEAIFTGGKHKGRMIVAEVGLPERHDNVAKYGGSRRLLEAFLAGMDVCPARPNQQGCP